MNGAKRWLAAAAGVLSLAVVAGSRGELVALPSSRLWVNGTSTVRPFTCNAKRLTARLGAPEGASLDLAELGQAVQSADLRVQVEALDCANDTMNEHLRKALQAKASPEIRFQLTSYEVGAIAGGRVPVTIAGELTMAGRTRAIQVAATATRLPDGTLRVVGEHGLRMTDYGVQPPTLFFGALQVHERVVVGFDLKLKEGVE